MTYFVLRTLVTYWFFCFKRLKGQGRRLELLHVRGEESDVSVYVCVYDDDHHHQAAKFVNSKGVKC